MEEKSGEEKRVEELRTRLKSARESYYNLSGSPMSDQEYDALKDELARLAPTDHEVTAVGAAVPKFSVWEKVRHEIPMGSLGKVNSESEYREWAQKAESNGGQVTVITHKIDGSSMELVYKSGALIRCVTRGDGVIGEDVTANVVKISSIPRALKEPVDATIRGEVVMFKDVFAEKYSSEYANPRNTAAGKVREKKGGGEACKDLVFLAYWVMMDNGPKTVWASMGWLQKEKFIVPDYFPCTNADAVCEAHAAIGAKRDSLEYEIDGTVVSVNSLEVLEEMGSHNMRPRGQVAWKFDAATCESRVVDVKWQVGPSGRITPVAVVEPVGVGGVTVTNVSLHNLSMFRELRLTRGCRVLISRRNDVIPFIEKNLDA